MSGPRAEAYLDTENLFHGLRPGRRPADDSAFAALAALLPHEPVRRPGAAGALFRALRDLLDWQYARCGIPPSTAHSYGKTVDAAVRLLREEARDVGSGYIETDRGTTPDAYRGQRPLVDFRADVDLGLPRTVEIAHVDVPQGKDEGELRLIADLREQQDAASLPDSCVLGSGDGRVMKHVDRLPRSLRGRMLVVLPPAAADLRQKLASTYPHVESGDVALLTELRVLAAKARQRPRRHTAGVKRRTGPPPTGRPALLPSPDDELVDSLVRVDWPTLRRARYGTAEWVAATRSLIIVDAVERSFADATFAARFDAPTRRATITALRDASIDPPAVRFLVTCAVLYDAAIRGGDRRAAVRQAIGSAPARGFLRDAMTGIQPLFVAADAGPRAQEP